MKLKKKIYLKKYKMVLTFNFEYDNMILETN